MSINVYPSTSGGGGGNSTGIGLYAQRALLNPVQGDQYYATDNSGQSVYDGSEWRPIVSGLVCKRVDLSVLNTWVNQNGASASQYGDSALINFPNVGGSYYSARVQIVNNKTEVIGRSRQISAQQGGPQPVSGVIIGNFATGIAMVAYNFGYPNPSCLTGGAAFTNPTTAAGSQNNSTNGSSGPVFVRVAAVPKGGNRVDGVAYAGHTPNGPWLELYSYYNLFNDHPPTMVGIYGNGYLGELNAIFDHYEAL